MLAHKFGRLVVKMPLDSAVSTRLQTKTLDILHKPETASEKIKRRLVYRRKRLELLDLIVAGIRIPGTMLSD